MRPQLGKVMQGAGRPEDGRSARHLPFLRLFLGSTFLGSVVTSTNVLNFGDLMILGMALPNLIGVYALSGNVRHALDTYWADYRAGRYLARAGDVTPDFHLPASKL